ncbi:nucleotidyltransferase domain-containing protein [Caldivirga sp. UBA161]|uniref:nucleotidyltransferase domain-containing protein n=1 Tax=Caldivirga sp. UBA161 TaxID=1915569 RepID=UPI0025C1E189|nr:nucleotidyltransferase domain-containing protein [Caldivirga sp. UBA161]
MLKLSEVLGRLKEFPWVNYPLLYVVLFGSLAKRGIGNDVDLAVEFTDGLSHDSYLNLYVDLMDHLNTDKIDLVLINDNVDCYLIHEVFNNSIIIYSPNADKAWSIIHRRAILCEDFLIDAGKLNLTEISVKAVVSRWES